MVMVSAAEGGGGKVKVDVGSMSGQSSSIASAVSSRVSGYMSTIGALNDFVGAGSLQGAAYSAAKTYASSILVAYYQANILYAETVADCAAELVTLYASICGSESLDQEVLEAQIAAYDTSISNSEASLRAVRQKEKENDLYADSGDSLRIQKQLSHLRSQRSAVQSKLEKLLQFNTSSSSVFSKADDSASLVSEAEATISASFGSKSFSMPANASWVNTVRSQWSDREQGVTKRYEAALAKVQNGESLTSEDVLAIERYQATYPDKVNQEAVKAAEAYRVDSRYQAVVSKVENGQELTENDIVAIEAYKQTHPNAKIDKSVVDAEIKYVNKNYQVVMDKLSRGESLSEKDILLISLYGQQHPQEQAPSIILDSGLLGVDNGYIQDGITIGEAARLMLLNIRITEGKNGNLFLNHGQTTLGKVLDKTTGIDKYFNQNRVSAGKTNTRITAKNGRTIEQGYDDLFDEFDYDVRGYMKEGGDALSKSVKSSFNTTLTNSVTSDLTMGVSDIVSYQKGQGFGLAESFKNAGKFGKGVALLNVALSVDDVLRVGTSETHQMAINKDIKVNSVDYYEAQAGGIAIDTGKNVAIGTASTLASVGTAAGIAALTTAGILSLPAVGVTAAVVGAGMLVGWGLNVLDEKFNISDGIKDWWTGFVKD